MRKFLIPLFLLSMLLSSITEISGQENPSYSAFKASAKQKSATISWEIDSAIFDPFPFSQLDLNYTQVPNSVACTYKIKVVARNLSSSALTGVYMKTHVYQDSGLWGNPGQGLIRTTNGPQRTVGIGASKVIESSISILPWGYYTAVFSVLGDSINSTPQLARDTLRFVMTADTPIVRDNNRFDTSIGPSDFHSPSNGDEIGLFMEFVDLGGYFANGIRSIDVFISGDSSNIGASLSPRFRSVYGTSFQNSSVDSGFFSVTITPQMLNSWVNIPIFPGIQNTVFAPYFVSVKQTNHISASGGFRIGLDTSAASSWDTSNYVYLSDGSNSRWQAIRGVVGIRMNPTYYHTPCPIVGLNHIDQDNIETNNLFYPNPNSGEFQLTNTEDFNQLEIWTIGGSLIYETSIVKGQKALDLRFLSQGVYLIQFISEHKVEKRKLVIHR